jgi:hypothetical protein
MLTVDPGKRVLFPATAVVSTSNLRHVRPGLKLTCSNTSTVALRVGGGDEKGTQYLGYNWATLFLGDINTRT